MPTRRKSVFPFNRSILSLSVGAALAVSATQVRATSELVPLGDLPGGSFYSSAYDVSADGSTVVGESSTGYGIQAFVWTLSGGLVEGNFVGSALGTNADGNVVVGKIISGSDTEAYLFNFTPAYMRYLGFLSGGGHYSVAWGVSADGSVVVGESDSGSGTQAFRWTQSSGMEGLGDLSGGIFFSSARDVSADGSVVVGYSSSGNGSEAFRWTQAGGMEGLGDLAGGLFESVANDVSADGSVVVGYSSSGNGSEAFRWTQAGGMEGLGDLPGGDFYSAAFGVSADGSVVVGWSESGSDIEAFRWTQSTGMQSVKQWLSDNGVEVGDVYLLSAGAANSDGSVVVGTGYLGNGGAEAFVARVDGATGSGLVTLDDVSDSLNATGQGGAATLRTSSTLINGAHSHPMLRRVESGKSTVWAAGDLGQDNHAARDGSFGIAEFGVGHNYGPMQVDLSLGKTWADQKLLQGGKVSADGQYLMLEGILPVSREKQLYATLGGFRQWGSADIRRGYLNAGLPDYSTATPEVDSWGVRARVDWLDAFGAGRFAFSPYADLAYLDSRMDGYTETGGGFPAMFNKRSDKVTEFRVGSNASMPISKTELNLVGTLEAAHRFDKRGPGASGTVIGLFDFNLEGQKYKSDWLRAAVGVEGKLGKGKTSLMLNGTTEGEAPSYWLAASWQVNF